MYAILRGDIHMTGLKTSSQLGHAFKLLTKNILYKDPETASKYFEDGMGTNVCMISKNLSDLMSSYNQAIELGLPAVLIIDEGHIHLPDFDGSPIVTAIGIGPCRRDQIKKLTRKFKMN